MRFDLVSLACVVMLFPSESLFGQHLRHAGDEVLPVLFTPPMCDAAFAQEELATHVNCSDRKGELTYAPLRQQSLNSMHGLGCQFYRLCRPGCRAFCILEEHINW